MRQSRENIKYKLKEREERERESDLVSPGVLIDDGLLPVALRLQPHDGAMGVLPRVVEGHLDPHRELSLLHHRPHKATNEAGLARTRRAYKHNIYKEVT